MIIECSREGQHFDTATFCIYFVVENEFIIERFHRPINNSPTCTRGIYREQRLVKMQKY